MFVIKVYIAIHQIHMIQDYF